jgi:hypothetical protein
MSSSVRTAAVDGSIAAASFFKGKGNLFIRKLEEIPGSLKISTND